MIIIKKVKKKKEKKKIVIKKNEYDVGRIIPAVKEDESYDFKISFLDYEFDIYAIPLFKKPIEMKFGEEGSREITYHKSKKGMKPIIHIKKIKYNDGKIYQNFPFEKLLEPTYRTEFPIPLCKISIPDSSIFRKYKKKDDHLLIDVQDQNIIEIYLTNRNFNFESFYKKWPNVDLALFFHAFEFWATNDLSYTKEKNRYFFSKDRKPRIARMSFPITDNMNILVNIYKDELFSENCNKLSIIFIENQQFFALLGHTPVMKTHKDKLEMAWKKDIENDEVFDLKEKEKWIYWFEKWKKILDREIYKRNKK